MSEIDRRREKLAERLSQPINTAAIVLMGIFSILWGLWVANPFWTSFDEAKKYSWLKDVMPEWAWGAVAIVVGGVITFGVIKNSFQSLSTGALTGAMYWGVVSTGYYIGDWRDTAGLTKTMICFYCAFIFLNIRMNRDRLS